MSYTIAGRVIKNEYLALGTIFATIGIASAKLGGGDKAAVAAKPAPVAQDTSIKADSKEEEDFIRQFVAAAEDGKSGAH